MWIIQQQNQEVQKTLSSIDRETMRAGWLVSSRNSLTGIGDGDRVD